MEIDNPVLAKWYELKDLIEALELDAHKNAKGVCAAGVRLRKGLRLLKSKSADLVKLTVERDKASKQKD